MTGRAALAAVLLLASPAAAAQSIPDTVEGIATDLAFGYCPLYLVGQFPLTGNDKLVELGFTDGMETAPNARFGDLHFVTQTKGGAQLSFGGADGKVCQVNVINGDGPKILAKMHEGLTFLPYQFEPDPANSGTRPNGASAETRMAKTEDGKVLRVQFIQGKLPGGQPIVGYQMFVMDQ